MSKQVFPSFCAPIMLLLALSFICQSAVGQVETDAGKFTNPLLSSGADPWVITWKGFYYYMNTTKESLTLWKTADISDLRNAEKKVVWTPEAGKAWSHGTWAPELYRQRKTR